MLVIAAGDYFLVRAVCLRLYAGGVYGHPYSIYLVRSFLWCVLSSTPVLLTRTARRVFLVDFRVASLVCKHFEKLASTKFKSQKKRSLLLVIKNKIPVMREHSKVEDTDAAIV